MKYKLRLVFFASVNLNNGTNKFKGQTYSLSYVAVLSVNWYTSLASGIGC